MLPTVQALSALWDEVRTRPLWAPPNFWRYLKLRREMRLRLLRPERAQVVAPPGKVNDCSSCTDICCIGPRSTVLLHLRDIATLVDIGRTELIRPPKDKPRFSEAEFQARPALRRHTQSRAWRTFPVLKQNSFYACAALSREGKCSLYPHWPLSCARFPYSLHADAMEVFYSPRCQSFWIRPDKGDNIQRMVEDAVASYNERIMDFVLLAYRPAELAALGLLAFLDAAP